MKYYFIICNKNKTHGVGYVIGDYDFDYLSEDQCVEKWEPISFQLLEGGFADFQTNDLGWPMCSIKLKAIIDEFASPIDQIQWLEAELFKQDEIREYYILHLPFRPDILDKQKTIFAGTDAIVKPYFHRTKIGNHQVFSFRGGETRVIVTETIHNEILSTGCTGIDFYSARIT